MRNGERQTVLGVLRECHGVSHQRAGCRESWHVRFGGRLYGKGLANCGYLTVQPTQPKFLRRPSMNCSYAKLRQGYSLWCG